jgi:D-alanyl-D-alanine carboxypeptidase
MKRIWIIIAVIVVVLVSVFFILSLSPGKASGEENADTEADASDPGPETGESAENASDASQPSPYDQPLLQEPEASDGSDAEIVLTKDDLSKWNLIVVNSKSPLDKSFRVDLVETVGGYLVDVRIYEALENMIADAAQDGVTLTICSAYRSVKDQLKLLEKKTYTLLVQGIDTDLAFAKAQQYLADPGESEHHTGLAVDIIAPGVTILDENFEKTGAFEWLSENAHRYGFIIRYPKGKEAITGFNYEPWHYRYVGTEHATAIKKSGLCLEEYLSTAK